MEAQRPREWLAKLGLGNLEFGWSQSLQVTQTSCKTMLNNFPFLFLPFLTESNAE